MSDPEGNQGEATPHPWPWDTIATDRNDVCPRCEAIVTRLVTTLTSLIKPAISPIGTRRLTLDVP